MKVISTIKNLPNKAGICIFKDKEGKIILIEKASDIKEKARYYVYQTIPSSQYKLLRLKIDTVDYIIEGDDLKAAKIELELIQKHHPPFNLRKRDQKKYRFIELSMAEDFPRVKVTKYTDTPAGSILIGPFRKLGYIKKAIHFATNYFQIADCSEEIFLGSESKVVKTCVRRMTKQCLRPCEVEIDNTSYSELIEKFIDLFENKNPALLTEIERTMKHHVAKQEFESAGIIRDGLNAINKSPKV